MPFQFRSASVLPKAALLWLALPFTSAVASNWPSWRGPNGDGTSPEKNVPLKWSATNNVRWKTPLPEPGDSSPIVWSNRVFITQAFEREGGRAVICFDRRDGRQLWKSGTTWKQPEKRYGKNPFCAASPVTDGDRVIAFFGSAGLFCFDMGGSELWRRDLGQQDHEWSYAASPLIHGDLCLLYFGPGLNARMLAFDKHTGKTLWEFEEPPLEKRPRTDGFQGNEERGVTGTFATPIIVKADGRDELVQLFPQRAWAFDPRTGDPLWNCDGLNELIYCSPIFCNGVLVAMGGFKGTTIAIKPGGKGDVTASHRLWQSMRTKDRLGSGIVAGDHVYVLNTEGIAECLELTTGNSLWQERVKGSGAKGESWSSMVLVDGHLLVLNKSGETVVLKASPKFEFVGVNPLNNELANSSHALSDGDVFIRTHQHLWCIGEAKKPVSK
jgi:outer membrane protein assembly factor BamB